jgi:hypothetical protein
MVMASTVTADMATVITALMATMQTAIMANPTINQSRNKQQ